MVNQLLAMARAEDQEHADAARRSVNLARLATETVRDFVPRALEKRIDLGYEGPETGEPPPAPGAAGHGHALLLRELIRNLVDNALQYTPAGGTVTVRVVDDPFGQVVVLQVEDSGPGIPPAEREQVFRPFYRALGTDVDGSGLGLAIVREIATQHDAEITLEDANLRHRPGLTRPGRRRVRPGRALHAALPGRHPATTRGVSARGPARPRRSSSNRLASSSAAKPLVAGAREQRRGLLADGTGAAGGARPWPAPGGCPCSAGWCGHAARGRRRSRGASGRCRSSSGRSSARSRPACAPRPARAARPAPAPRPRRRG